jgi:glycosyltransferase involved in cell wall biosynthesis
MEMKISLCLTNYNRTDLLFESFAQVIDDPRLDEIVISDDCSTDENFMSVYTKFKDVDKVKIYRNERNLDCYLNKAKAIERAKNEWVIIFDSDNILTKEYLDRIENLIEAGLNRNTIYQPEFAKPHFNFEFLSGQMINCSNVGSIISRFPNTNTMLNAMNYFVNRDEYLRVFDYGANPVTSDSIYQNFRWLDAGNFIYVVPGLQYEHRIHEGSHYRINERRTPRNLHSTIVNNLKQMKCK